MKIKTWQYIVIGFLMLGAVVLLALDSWLTPYDLGKERVAARAAGLPLSNAEFVRPQPLPSQDAGPEWLALDRDLRRKKLDTTVVDTAIGQNRVMPTSAIPAVRRMLHDRADVVAAVHSAAGKPAAFFEHDFTVADLFPYLAAMRTGAKLLRYEARMLAREGRYAEAVRTQELGLNIADQLASDPSVIGMLVSIAVNDISTAGMEDILYTAGPNEEVSRLVTEALQRHPPKTNLALAFKGETLMGVNTIRGLNNPARLFGSAGAAGAAGSTTGLKLPVTVGPLGRRFFINPNEASYLHWMTRQYAAAKLPRPERTNALEQITRELEAKRNARNPAIFMSTLLMPGYSRAEVRNMSQDARHAVALAAAAVLAYRDRNGRWPGTLVQAMPQPPPDPLNAPKAIGYRRGANGFVVYSAGEAKTFSAMSGQPEKNQYLFRYPAPAVLMPKPGKPPAEGRPGPSGPPMPGAPPVPGGSI